MHPLLSPKYRAKNPHFFFFPVYYIFIIASIVLQLFFYFVSFPVEDDPFEDKHFKHCI